jgi:hypothetical protein
MFSFHSSSRSEVACLSGFSRSISSHFGLSPLTLETAVLAVCFLFGKNVAVT